MDNPGLIEWGAAAMAQPGQDVCGDRFVVAPFANGVLVAVVDGLGHGEQAAAAADIAIDTLQAHACESVLLLVQRCHAALARTRGVVLTLASFDARDHSMTWLGVGNVEGMLYRATSAAQSATCAPPVAALPHETVLLRGGVVGYQLPPLRASVLPVARGDRLILATDGIRSGFDDDKTLTGPPQQVADCILSRYNRGTDDALVLVVCYVGGGC